MRLKTSTAVSAVSLLLLGACAQTETKPVQPQENRPAVQTAARYEPPKAAAPAPVAPAAEQRSSAGKAAFADHTEIEFDAKSRDLGNDARGLIASLRDSVKKARHIVVTGYCDKRAAANAKEIALFRAMTVKNELVNLGAAEKSVRVKYVTSEAKHEVTIDMTER